MNVELKIFESPRSPLSIQTPLAQMLSFSYPEQRWRGIWWEAGEGDFRFSIT